MTKSITKITYATLVAAIGLAMSSSLITGALADSPHFLSATLTLSSQVKGAAVCDFKEAGLGNSGGSAAYTCSGKASATYVCINGGGNHPKAANKETVTAPVSSSGEFPIRNGQTTGKITIGPPGPGGFSCPGGQKLVLACVTYTDVILKDNTFGTTVSLGGITYTDPQFGQFC